MEIAKLDRCDAFITADGSTIRELAGAGGGGSPARAQSLAQATVEPGAETAEHYHPRSEEIYHFTAGRGRMRLGTQTAEVSAGDCVVIAPGTVHKLFNDGTEPLILLCCCAPPYSHDDTILTGG